MTGVRANITVDISHMLKPCAFVDTGVDAMLGALYDMGAQRQNLIAKVAGAGSPLGPEGSFRIGPRNLEVLRKLLGNKDIPIDKEDVGGSRARTLFLHMNEGKTTVKSEGKEVEL